MSSAVSRGTQSQLLWIPWLRPPPKYVVNQGNKIASTSSNGWRSAQRTADLPLCPVPFAPALPSNSGVLVNCTQARMQIRARAALPHPVAESRIRRGQRCMPEKVTPARGTNGGWRILSQTPRAPWPAARSLTECESQACRPR